MSRGSFISSAVLHGVVLTLMAMDFSLADFDNTPPPPAILTIDLTRVQISDKTNLPPKVQTKQKTHLKKATPPPAKPKTVAPTKVQPKPPAPPKPVPQPPIKDAAPVIEPPKKEKNAPKKETPKPAPQPQPKPEPKTPSKPSADDKLKNLLASVEHVRQSAPALPPSPEPEPAPLTEGVEGGTSGSLSQLLTISERDLIASQLSACWNLDAGKKDIENIIIEIRASVNKDGTVREVEILNKNLNAVHLSVAESARRAVLVCDKKGDGSPFRILADKYADHYGDWKTMHLRFNPLTGLFQ